MTVYSVSIAEAASAADTPSAEAHFFAARVEVATAVDTPSAKAHFNAARVEAASATDHPVGGWGVATHETASAIATQSAQASFHPRIVEAALASDTPSSGPRLLIAHESANAQDHPSAQVHFHASVLEKARALDPPSAVLVVGGVPQIYDYPFYFAWIDPVEVFSPTIHNREDVEIISYNLSQREGEFALLDVEIRNPRIGLLNPGRYYWCYFSWFNGSEIVLLFKGRLQAIPDNIFAERATIKFVGRPLDYLAQQQAIALGIMNAGPPGWDPAFIAPEKRLDPDTALEALSAAWAIDRTNGVVTTSNFIAGEDGTLAFTDLQGLYYSVKFTIDKPPARSVYCNSTVTWQQRGTGLIDMGAQAIQAYSGESIYNDWPKPLTSIGGGWSVEFSSVFDTYNLAKTDTVSSSFDWKNTSKTHHFGDTMKASVKWSRPYFRPGVTWQRHVATQFTQWAYISTNPNFVDTPEGISRYTDVWVPQWSLATQLILRWEAKRDRIENVRFTLAADLQPVFSDPGGEAANFAQDSELLEIAGRVGLEGPYGQWKGEWTPVTEYAIYDYFTVLVGGFQRTYQATRNHLSLTAFDISTTSTVWQPDTLYAAGESVWVSPSDLVDQDVQNALDFANPGPFPEPGLNFPPLSQAGGWVYAVLLSHTSGGSFDPNALDANGNVIYDLRVNPFSGKPMYQAIPSFRGLWTPGTIYSASDMFIPPSPYVGLIMKVVVAHTSPAVFTLFDTDPTGRLLYAMLLNPPIIGDLLSNQYFSTARGKLSLQYLILKAEALLDFRSRCARTTFEVPFADAASSGISCRMMASVSDGRLPGGVALGKIVEYKLFQKEGGPPMAEIQIASVPGNGNTLPGGFSAVGGTSAVGYTQPASGTVDDGLTFEPLTKSQAVISETLQTSSPGQLQALILAEQAIVNQQQFNADIFSGMNYNTAYLETKGPALLYEQQAEAWAQALASSPTWYELVLNPVDNGPFAYEVDLTVTLLMMDKQIDLEAPSTA